MSDTAPNPCSPCGKCCRSYIVPVSGYDIWRICRGQQLAPQNFLVAIPVEEQVTGLFQLQAGGANFALLLDKRGPFKRTQPCVFLMELGEGYSSCGIYADRPITCRTYPMVIWDRALSLGTNALCPPGAWAPREVARPSWRTHLQRAHLDFDLYHEVVARWNARVAARTHLTFGLPDYYSYLLNVYDRLAALNATLGDPALDRAVADWPTPPRQGLGKHERPADPATRPWLAYFLQVQAIIDSFYPDLPSQPSAALQAGEWLPAYGQSADVARPKSVTS